MSRVKRIRESIDGSLNRWQARAEAVEAHLEASHDQALERVEAGKKAYLEAIDKVKASVIKSKTMAEEEKQRILTRIDETRVQIALGKAETIEEFKRQQEAMRNEVNRVEREVETKLAAYDAKVDESLDEMAEELVRAGDALDAELDASAMRLEGWKGEVKAGFKAKTDQVKSHVAAFKAKIAAQREGALAKKQAFETEFNEGWNQIKSAFRGLK